MVLLNKKKKKKLGDKFVRGAKRFLVYPKSSSPGICRGGERVSAIALAWRREIRGPWGFPRQSINFFSQMPFFYHFNLLLPLLQGDVTIMGCRAMSGLRLDFAGVPEPHPRHARYKVERLSISRTHTASDI